MSDVLAKLLFQGDVERVDNGYRLSANGTAPRKAVPSVL